MNQYEIAVLYDPGLEVGLEKATSRVEKIFKDNGGKVVSVDNWGKRKLAYPIKKNDFAIYLFYTLELPPASVQRIENTLNITEEVIRFLIVRPDLKAIAKAEAEMALQKKRAAERDEKGETPNSDDESNNESVQ